MNLALSNVVSASASAPRGWAIASARLKARTPELVNALAVGKPSQIICEEQLTDPVLRLRGTPDVVTIGTQISVIDLKSETAAHVQVSAWAIFQLTVYAHLVMRAYGKLPDRVEVFSLNRGRLPLLITRSSVEQALTSIAIARDTDKSAARPSRDVCRFCARRLECEPHWEASKSWAEADCVEGTVGRVEHAATGVVAIRVDRDDGPEWITGIPDAAVSISEGEWFRAVRIRAIVNRNGQNWLWTGVAAGTSGY